MTWQIVRNSYAEYAVDWETIDRLNRSFRLAEAILGQARTVNLSELRWYNPLSWDLPTVYNVEVDWPRVRTDSSVLAARDLAQWKINGARSMISVGEDMMERIKLTPRLKSCFQDLVASASSRTMKNISIAEDKFEGLIEASKFVRDTSFDAVGVGATFMTGGMAATLALGASATMKGVAKFQDTGQYGPAIAQAVGSATFGAFKIRPAFGLRKLTSSEDYVLIVCQGVVDTSWNIVAGDAFAKEALKGAFKVVGELGMQFVMNIPVVENLIKKMPIPVRIGMSLTQDAATKSGSEFLAGKFSPRTPSGTMARPASLLDDVSAPEQYDELLLKLAIINQKKGAGWGW